MLTALIVACVSFLPQDPPRAQLRDVLQARLDELRTESGCPGLTAAFVRADGTAIELATGFADEEHEVAMTPQHRMLAGSTGKLFFAALAQQLVQDGAIDLDAKAATVLADEPWFARLPNHADFTIRQLMNHTSGLVRYELDPAFLATLQRDRTRAFTIAERLECLYDTKAPFRAGERFEYSDTNYIVLGAILEKAIDGDAYAAIQTRVLDPLRLDGVVAANSLVIERLAQGYPAADDPFTGGATMLEDGRLMLNPQFEWAGGGFATTAGDLARFVRHQFGNGGLSVELRSQVVDGVAAPALGQNARYGLCCIVKTGPLGTTLGHSGFFPGYMSEVRWFDDHAFAVAVQTNTSDFARAGKGTGWMVMELAKSAIAVEAAPK